MVLKGRCQVKGLALRKRTVDSLLQSSLHKIGPHHGKKEPVGIALQKVEKITVGNLGGIAEGGALAIHAFLTGLFCKNHPVAEAGKKVSIEREIGIDLKGLVDADSRRGGAYSVFFRTRKACAGLAVFSTLTPTLSLQGRGSVPINRTGSPVLLRPMLKHTFFEVTHPIQGLGIHPDITAKIVPAVAGAAEGVGLSFKPDAGDLAFAVALLLAAVADEGLSVVDGAVAQRFQGKGLFLHESQGHAPV